jgi:hypothetical protein
VSLAHKSFEELKIATLVVIDAWDDTVRKAYSGLPNSARFIEMVSGFKAQDASLAPAPLLNYLLSIN